MERPLKLLITAVLLHLRFHFFSAAAALPQSPAPLSPDYIQSSCRATLYPEVCYSSLSPYSKAVQNNPSRLARVAIAVCLSEAENTTSFIYNLYRQADKSSVPRAAAALLDCSSNFGDAVDEIRRSLKQIRQLRGTGADSFRFLMSNVQTWMSAALTDEETCTDGFEDVPEGPLKTMVFDRTVNVKKFTSNALALVNSYADKGSP